MKVIEGGFLLLDSQYREISLECLGPGHERNFLQLAEYSDQIMRDLLWQDE